MVKQTIRTTDCDFLENKKKIVDLVHETKNILSIGQDSVILIFTDSQAWMTCRLK